MVKDNPIREKKMGPIIGLIVLVGIFVALGVNDLIQNRKAKELAKYWESKERK
jgi:hypothetical protein